MKIEPGVYPDVPMEVYATWDAANFSTIKKFDRSAAHAREVIVNPPDQTPAMALGSATHAAVLEPELFKKDWAIAPECDRRTNKGKATWAKFLVDSEGKLPLTAKEYAQCCSMAHGAHQNPDVVELIKNPGFSELSFVWVDKATGVLCKGRIDRLGRLWGNSVIADLKTTQNASEDAWNYEVRKYRYHAQGAMYLDGLEEAAPAAGRRFLWLPVEKDAPFETSLYEPDEATVDKGRRMYRKWLREWKRCQDTGVWSGYPRGVRPLMLSDYHLRHEDGEEAEEF